MGISEEDIQREIDELKAGWNVSSDEEFLQILELQGIHGEQDLYDRVVSHLVLQNLIGHVGEFSEEELKAEYELGEQREASHILIRERELAEEVLERVRAGEDFAELAEAFSQDPGSRDEGGQLGYFQRGTMTPPFEEAAFNTEVGSVSNLVETSHGYHIIQVTDKKEFEESFEEVKETLRSALNNRKIYQMGQKQQELFAEVEVNVLDPSFKLPKFTN
ncbi:MAG: peptidylprolyl isomerase [Bacillus sp. (in: Bacteria)]|nr:peptidylprolyl isomerase [Bacillus sp. (in: firmicutes)]